jgi:F420-dependent oxidoreductase-like protein
MQLGLSLGPWGTGDPSGQLALAAEADRLGYAVVWAAEAYGNDAASTLAWIGAKTTRIDLGAAVFQIPARTAAMTAMTAATIDSLSGGRFRLGLGVSGPQVSEGWHGVRFDDPLGRTREYVDVVRAVLRRERVSYTGHHISLPLPDGSGKPLRLTIKPPRADLPIYLGAIGPRNLELAGEIADGWLGVLFAPEHAAPTVGRLRAGRERSDRPWNAFDLAPTVPVVIGADVEACADAVRAHVALYVGGMGSRQQNFYNRLVASMGFAEVAADVQAAYLDGRPRDAAAMLPLALLDAVALLGPVERVAERITRYADAGVTTLSVTPFEPALPDRLATMRALAELVDPAGRTRPGNRR